jgi:hypothetical protein
VAVVFFLYRRNQASKAASSAAPTLQVNPVPAQPAVSGQDLSALLGYLTAQQGVPSQPAPVVAAPATTSTGGTNFATAMGNADAGSQMLDIIGSITAPSTYTGYNVTGGAPVYALINGQWKIGVPAANIPVGTQLATPVGSATAINTAGGTVTERLG